MSKFKITCQPKMQTLAQAHRYLNGKVPHRHNDVPNVNIESNIIFNTGGLYYATFPRALAPPCGFDIFCTVQDFVDFQEPTMAELFVFDIRDISLCGDVKTADQMIAKGWVKK
jgi:hypothetical protein